MARPVVIVFALALVLVATGCNRAARTLPQDISAVFGKPVYQNAVWGLRVVDLNTGEVLYDQNPDYRFFIGSVRKLFSVGFLLNEIGPEHTSVTPVYRRGTVADGILSGDLILVASGDLTMGGRTNPDGTIAISDYDHNEANSLGNAVLTAPDPLAGYRALAKQVAESGITEVTGEVIIDDRLFVPFNFRDEFEIRSIFVNDDVVDVTIQPTAPGRPASVQWRPQSAAFAVKSTLGTVAAGSEEDVELTPELPDCLGAPACSGTVSGRLPVDYVPPLTSAFPLVQTFRIVDPASYARTVFIEALREAGVTVRARFVMPNPAGQLPPPGSYAPDMRIAELRSLPYSDHARLILKVSYNIGADTSLVLFGLTQGVDSMPDALRVERTLLVRDYGIRDEDFEFVDGSGGGLTKATNRVVTAFLDAMSRRAGFIAYRDALPVLGIDGSLAFVTEFARDPSLAGAKGRVMAKTGTFIEGTPQGPVFRAQALGGYVQARSGRRLAFQLVVNEVGPVTSIEPVLQTFQDQGTIAAILWRDY